MNLTVLPYSKKQFFAIVQEESMQTRYLFDYLSHIGAETIILEKHYIDRYYMEEYQHYYSSCFKHMHNFCQRLHFFRKETSKDLFNEYLSGNDDAKKQIQDNYLGYIVIRPLSTIRIGRTVLKTYDSELQRHYITRKYEAHLASLSLPIKSIAFQQQDRGVGACATTAIWSSLQKICNDNGYRCPGPFDISQKAIKYSMPLGRGFPQITGLTSEQMYQAIASTGFTPLRINCSDQNFNKFKAILLGYLNSDISPIMVLLQLKSGLGHAVTVTGYSAKEGYCSFGDKLRINVRDLEKIYIHDDRIGPYVSTNIQERKFKEDELKHARNLGFNSDTAIVLNIKGHEWIVSEIITPLYHKIRSTILDILNLSHPLIDTFQKHDAKSKYIVSLRIKKDGKYLEEIRDAAELPPKEKIRFLKRINLPRYVGIVEVTRNESLYFTILWDTTDLPRHKINNFGEYAKDILGVVCYDASARLIFKDLWNQWNVKVALL